MSLFTVPTLKACRTEMVLFQYSHTPFRAMAQLFALIHLVKSSSVIASFTEMMLDAVWIKMNSSAWINGSRGLFLSLYSKVSLILSCFLSSIIRHLSTDGLEEVVQTIADENSVTRNPIWPSNLSSILPRTHRLSSAMLFSLAAA